MDVINFGIYYFITTEIFKSSQASNIYFQNNGKFGDIIFRKHAVFHNVS